MDWEVSKENFQPLKEGRDPKCLTSPDKVAANAKISLIEKERGYEWQGPTTPPLCFASAVRGWCLTDCPSQAFHKGDRRVQWTRPFVCLAEVWSGLVQKHEDVILTDSPNAIKETIRQRFCAGSLNGHKRHTRREVIGRNSCRCWNAAHVNCRFKRATSRTSATYAFGYNTWVF
jgi:hypothetical protein